MQTTPWQMPLKQERKRQTVVLRSKRLGNKTLRNETKQQNYKANLWYIYTAQSVTKVNKAMQSELLGSDLLRYFVEWCSRDSKRVRGVAYQDALAVYNDINPQQPILKHHPKY